jgi:hypothetical protein
MPWRKRPDAAGDGMFEVRRMECPLCNTVWTAVHPAECDKLECPGCAYLMVIEDHEIIDDGAT